MNISQKRYSLSKPFYLVTLYVRCDDYETIVMQIAFERMPFYSDDKESFFCAVVCTQCTINSFSFLNYSKRHWMHFKELSVKKM
jgi:hypothetical protein